MKLMEQVHVVLRPVDEHDTETIVQWRGDPRIAAHLFAERGPTCEEHERWLEALRQRNDREEFMIVDRETGRAIGTIGLSCIDRQSGVAEYGILLDPDWEGQGRAREASDLILRHAFDDLALKRVVLELFKENEQALRLYQRLGFERLSDGERVKSGTTRPTVHMELCAERFATVRART